MVQGNIFIGMCQSFCSGGSLSWRLSDSDPPLQITPIWQRRGSVHPTGMHSCCHPQRSCGKVMFLHLSVILFTGGVCILACIGVAPPQADTSRADTPRQIPLWADNPRADHSPHGQTATAADSTYPTGMHSCY